MKIRYSIWLLLIIFGLSSLRTLAQQKPEEEWTKEEAQKKIEEYQATVQDLKNKSNALDADIQKLKDELNLTVQRSKDCRDSYYKLLGATDADITNFRQALAVLDGKVKQMERLSNDELAEKKEEVAALEAELNKMRTNKIAIIDEFYNKIIQLAREIKGLYREPSQKKYTVGTWAENRDCLWNIAGKNEIYGDPFQWPKIWQGNTDVIKNPDIIQPGWTLLVPKPGPKSTDEIKAERKYWRNKRAMMEKKSDEPGKKAAFER
jgi:nucleoid-associated protein YgaU